MPTPCSVSGTLQTLTGGLIAQGKVIFQLTNIGTGNPIGVSGTSLIPALTYTVMTGQNGAFAVNLWGNDNINPSNTLYAVTFRDFQGNEVGPILYSIVGGSANLNSLSAVSTTTPPVLSVSAVLLLNAQANLAPIAGNSGTQVIYTYTLPANTVGTLKGFRLTTGWNHSTGNAIVNYDWKLNGQSLVGGGSGASVPQQIVQTAVVLNTGATTGTSTAIFTAAATPLLVDTVPLTGLNWASPQVLQFTFNVANTDQITPISWLVELIQ